MQTENKCDTLHA